MQLGEVEKPVEYQAVRLKAHKKRECSTWNIRKLDRYICLVFTILVLGEITRAVSEVLMSNV